MAEGGGAERTRKERDLIMDRTQYRNLTMEIEGQGGGCYMVVFAVVAVGIVALVALRSQNMSRSRKAGK